jgi:hypothetical protein
MRPLLAGVLLCSAVATAQPAPILVPGRSIDGVELGSAWGPPQTPNRDHWEASHLRPDEWSRFAVTVQLEKGRVSRISFALVRFNRLTISGTNRALEGRTSLFEVAQTAGTCGPLVTPEGGSYISCDGFRLEQVVGMGSDEGHVRVVVEPGLSAPKTGCSHYVEAAARLDLKPADRLCYGDRVFTTDSTLEQVQKALVMASEVVPDPDGQRLRSRELSFVFGKNKKLLRVENATPAPGARGR